LDEKSVEKAAWAVKNHAWGAKFHAWGMKNHAWFFAHHACFLKKDACGAGKERCFFALDAWAPAADAWFLEKDAWFFAAERRWRKNDAGFGDEKCDGRAKAGSDDSDILEAVTRIAAEIKNRHCAVSNNFSGFFRVPQNVKM